MRTKTSILLFFLCVAALAADPDDIQPPMPSPVADFRKWLLMKPADRTMALARRPEKSRKVIEAALEEYSSLPDEERNRRLDSIELRWFMRPLMEKSPESRSNLLAQVPVPLQPIVQVRLEQWDGMPKELRAELLDHELTMQYFSAPPHQQHAMMKTLPAAERSRLEQRIAAFRQLTPAERAKLDERLSEFLSMGPLQQQKTLNNFSEAERQEMAKTLLAFKKLAPAQQRTCIASFEKFARMTAAEQMVFLKNAERWEAMSEEDRKTWREVVRIVPPIPDLDPGAPPLPNVR